MLIDLSRFKVIYGNKVLNAVALMGVQMPDNIGQGERSTVEKPKFIEIFAINEDGNIISIEDEAWRFQFIPNIPLCPD